MRFVRLPSMFTRRLNWTHWIACLLVAVTAVLLCFGALVTTYEAAMAVPDWPATYGHNMFLFPLAEWLGGPWDLFLEHGHRLLGALVGLIALALAGVAWRYPVGPTVRWLAVAAVVLVVVEGGLGGARVLLDDTTVARTSDNRPTTAPSSRWPCSRNRSQGPPSQSASGNRNMLWP